MGALGRSLESGRRAEMVAPKLRMLAEAHALR